MRHLLVMAGLLLTTGSIGVLSSVISAAVRWPLAVGLLLIVAGLVLRHATRPEGSLLARSCSTAAHVVFIVGCGLGLTLAVLRLGIGSAARELVEVLRSVDHALLVGVAVAFGLGLVLDAGYLWSTLDAVGPGAAVASAGAGLAVGWSALAGVGIFPLLPLLVLVVVGIAQLVRAVDVTAPPSWAP